MHSDLRAGRFALIALMAGGVAVGCIDPKSPLLTKSAEGCDEFVAGADVDSNLAVDPNVRSFMQAASDFTRNGEAIKADTLTACANIAKDLGAPDTWSTIEDSGDAISNNQGTGACDSAGSLIEQAFIDAGTVNATVAIAVSRGECHLDFEEQKRCDAECTLNESCDPGSVETRCEPGALSVVCEGTCNAGAYCVGTAEAPSSCKGHCQAECEGECKGECIGEAGSATTDNPNCRGKCSASCHGSCRGKSKVEGSTGISCGAHVRCTGGCTGTFSEPTCTTTYKPPKCNIDVDCHAACSARVTENAVCDPTRVQVFADVNATPQMKAIVDTLNTNFPSLFTSAEAKGKLLLDAAQRLGDTGASLQTRIEDLDGKSLACLGKASTTVGQTIGSVNISVKASVQVTLSATEHAQ